MFKKNKKGNLAILVSSILCMSAIGFSSVSAMQSNNTVDQMRRDIANIYYNAMINKHDTYDEVATGVKQIKDLMSKYSDLMNEQINRRESRRNVLENTLIEIKNIIRTYHNIIGAFCTRRGYQANSTITIHNDNISQVAEDYSRDSEHVGIALEALKADFLNFRQVLKKFLDFMYPNNNRIDANKTTECLNYLNNEHRLWIEDTIKNDYDHYMKSLAIKRRHVDKIMDNLYTIENMKTVDFSEIDTEFRTMFLERTFLKDIL